jgi:prepilin-type N-terminal cleavage/methylation domain-containing protein
LVNAALQQRPRRAGRGGFTLLEMLLVIGLLSMLAGVLVAGSASLLKGTARSDPEDALLALMQTLRRQAVERGATIELEPFKPADDPDRQGYRWTDPGANPEDPPHEELLPALEGVKVQLLGPEVDGAILLGGQAVEQPLARLRFYPDGTCDRVRLEVVRNDARRLNPIDPLTCAPLPPVDAR